MAALQADTGVPVSDNLNEDAEQAARDKLPIMLVFTGMVCSYCDELEEEIIKPMLLSGDYGDKAIIRKLVVDNGSRVTDFSEQRIDTADLAQEYGVFVTPTILFVNHEGYQLAERMVGINTIEMYGGYLDQCIESALLRLRDPVKGAREQACRVIHRRPSDSSPADFNPATT
ncbi:MAG: thioredoxin fold domain-containing protein [Gammaproteobacteria bacterium]|nr:MAG: thioredoxin fold domain-containing protein [Gammaproteobacteria bacterium]